MPVKIMERIHPVKSPNDPKDYLGLILSNGLKLLLVSDFECDKAAVSVSVGAGSMCDPESIAGLAHLCEHLLSFQVSKPNDKPFNAFVAANGGMFNAFTARDQTNFHLDVAPLAFEEALTKFANFFITIPKMEEKDIINEISIVDSEHKSKINKDSWRKMAVDASTAKKTHPYHKFTTGNKTTLLDKPIQEGIDLVKAVIDFRLKYYVSNLMAVVVYGKESISWLEKVCVPLFGQFPDNKNAVVPEWSEWPYGEHELRKRINIVSLADIRDFYVTFPIPNMRPFYKTFPMGYISRLLGNRGQGSLYTHLYDKHWVEYSYMSSSVPARGFGEVSISFQLTKLGLEFVDEIVLHIFQYIKMLKERGPHYYFWEEMQQILSIQFTFQEKENPIEFVQRISNLLHVYPCRDVLSVGYLITEYKPEIIEQFMEYLHPDNCRVITVCKANEDNETEFLKDHWYGAKFTSKPISDKLLEKWKFCETCPQFHLPNANKFIPSDFALKPRENKIDMVRESDGFFGAPQLIMQNSLNKVWFLQDDYFKTAKGVIRLEIFSPLPMSDPVLYNVNQILFLTLKNITSEAFYPATVAGCFHDIKPTLYGAKITLSGFSDKLMNLMEEIIRKITSQEGTIDEIKNHYGFVVERYATGLRNSKNLPLQNISTYFLSILLREKGFTNEELLEVLNDISEDSLTKYMKYFFRRSHFEWLVHGNFSSSITKSLVNTCFECMRKHWLIKPLIPAQNVRLREICIDQDNQYVFESSRPQTGSSCTLLLQTGPLSLKESVYLEIIDQIMYEPLFTQLRNQEQIGYIVRSSIRKSGGCQGLLIFVESQIKPDFISERIVAALNCIEDRLTKIDENNFTQHKNSVRLRKLESPRTMLIHADKIWNSEIFSRRYDFHRISKELKALEEARVKEVLEFYTEHFSESSSKRRILQVWLSQHSVTDESGMSDQTVPNSTSEKFSKFSKIYDIPNWKLKMNIWKLENC